jgi:hypothetical protein
MPLRNYPDNIGARKKHSGFPKEALKLRLSVVKHHEPLGECMRLAENRRNLKIPDQCILKLMNNHCDCLIPKKQNQTNKRNSIAAIAANYYQ